MPPPFRLLAITPPEGPVPADTVSRWLGSDIALLLREPGTPAAQLLADHHRLAPLRRACIEAGIPVLLSLAPHELDLPLPSFKRHNIAGLHLRGDPDLATLTRARALLARSVAPDSPGPADASPRAASPDSPAALSAGPWLGRSCHGLAQPGDALVDYTLFAPVFTPTTAQPGRPLGSKIPAGLAALQAWTAGPGAVVFALGGVTPATAASCLAVGVWGLAGIGVFFGEPGQVEQDVAALRELLAASDRHVEPVSPR